MILRFLANPYVKGLTIISAIVSLSLYLFGFISPNKVDLQLILEKKELLVNDYAFDKSLKVYYDSIEIGKNNRPFLFTFKIINNGKKEIGYEYFDTIGLNLKNNSFLTKPILDSSTEEYYVKKAKLKTNGDSLILIPALIFNAKDFFRFSFISIERDQRPIEFSVMGNIKEQGKLNLITSSSNQNYIADFFKQSIVTHLIRLVFYLFIFLTFLGIINIGLFIIHWIIKVFQKNERKRNVETFKSLDNYFYTKIDDVVFSRYIDEGQEKLVLFNNKIQEMKKLNFHINKYSLTESYLNKVHSEQELKELSKEKKKYLFLLQELKKDGYLYFENGTIKKDIRLITLMQEFLSQLKIKEKNR